MGGGGAARQGDAWTADRGTRPDRTYCCVRRWDSKGRRGRCRVRPGSGMMSIRICSGETTSQKGQDRGTSAGDAPSKRGRSRMTAWAFPNATMRTTDARGQWWGPVLRLPKEVQEDEEAQGEVEVWWGEEEDGQRTGVQLGCNTVLGLQKEDNGVAVSFRMTDAGRPDKEAPIVLVGHKCGGSARRIRLTVQGLPADSIWYFVLVQAYLEQGRARADRA